MTRHTPRVIGLAAILALAVLLAGVSPAAASHDGGESDTIAERIGASDDGTIATLRAVTGGLSDRVSYGVSSLSPFSDATPAATHADDTQDEFNENSAVLVETANNNDLAGWFEHHSDRSNNVDVVSIEFTGEDGDTATRYLVATYNASTGAYDAAEMTASTNRTVDSTVTLGARASANAAGDLETFVDEHAGNATDVPTSYRRGLAAKYKGDVESPLIPDVGLGDILRGL